MAMPVSTLERRVVESIGFIAEIFMLCFGQFIRRFAGIEYIFASAVKDNWAILLKFLHESVPSGSNSKSLKMPAFTAALLHAQG